MATLVETSTGELSRRRLVELIGAAMRSVQQRMFDVDEVARLCLVALYTDGHVLLEANPGMGKTELVKALSGVLKLPYGRIQFTPDLMPADITGTFMPNFEHPESGGLEFRHGPVFTSLLLADEINRATPKTQSAMLEAMAERQVTVLGETYRVPDGVKVDKGGDPSARRGAGLPFAVLATQNPIDQEGTFNLPEAQADRFMFKVLMPVPRDRTLRRIMGKQAGAISQDGQPAAAAPPPAGPAFADEKHAADAYRALKAQIPLFEPLRALEDHIVNLVLASNGEAEGMIGVEAPQRTYVKTLVQTLVTYGLGPRAAIALMLGAKAWAFLFNPDASYADGPALARVVIPVLRHRLKLAVGWQEQYPALFEKARQLSGAWAAAERYATADAGEPGTDPKMLERLLARLCIATAPKVDGRGAQYQDLLEDEFAKVAVEYGWPTK